MGIGAGIKVNKLRKNGEVFESDWLSDEEHMGREGGGLGQISCEAKKGIRAEKEGRPYHIIIFH